MVKVELLNGEMGVSPGQACVFYDSEDIHARVLGGGTINSRIGLSDAIPTQAVQPHASQPVGGQTETGIPAV